MPVERGLRLLSLDGGGIRGLSQLLILKELMERLKFEKKLDAVPRPCDVFDMIAGSGTGGLIAIFIGRLCMSVDQAIEEYMSISTGVFSKLSLFETKSTRTRKLEASLRAVIRPKTGNGDELMIGEARTRQCRVFVCVMPAQSLSPGMPRILRTYTANSQDDDLNCAIWQAARATLATPLLFDPVNIGQRNMDELFIDGSFGCNNPLNILFNEACRVFPDRHVSCIISLGSGHLGPLSVSQRSTMRPVYLGKLSLIPGEIIQFLAKVASDCEEIANDIAERFSTIPNVYFRFVCAGGQYASDQDSAVKNATSQYLLDLDVEPRISRAVSLLKTHVRGKISTQQLCYYQISNAKTRSIFSSVQGSLSTLTLGFRPRYLYIPPRTPSTGVISVKRDGLETVTEQERNFTNLDTRWSQHNRALSLHSQGHYAEAESMYKEALTYRQRAFGLSNVHTLRTQHNLAVVLHDQGRYAEAESICRDVLVKRQDVLGKDHAATRHTQNELALNIAKQGRYAHAELVYRDALAQCRTIFGLEHMETLRTQKKLAITLDFQVRYAEAEAVYRDILTSWQKVLGKHNVDTLATQHSLALILDNRDQYAEAESIYRDVLASHQTILIEGLRTQHNLAYTLNNQGRHAEAEALYRDTLTSLQRILGLHHTETLQTQHNLALNLCHQGCYAEAEVFYRNVLKGRHYRLGYEHEDTLQSEAGLAETLCEQEKYPEAEALFKDVVPGRQKVLGKEHEDTLRSQQWLAFVISKQHRRDEAETLFREVLKIQKRVLGLDHEDTRNTQREIDNISLSKNIRVEIVTSGDTEHHSPSELESKSRAGDTDSLVAGTEREVYETGEDARRGPDIEVR